MMVKVMEERSNAYYTIHPRDSSETLTTRFKMETRILLHYIAQYVAGLKKD